MFVLRVYFKKDSGSAGSDVLASFEANAGPKNARFINAPQDYPNLTGPDGLDGWACREYSLEEAFRPSPSAMDQFTARCPEHDLVLVGLDARMERALYGASHNGHNLVLMKPFATINMAKTPHLAAGMGLVREMAIDARLDAIARLQEYGTTPSATQNSNLLAEILDIPQQKAEQRAMQREAFQIDQAARTPVVRQLPLRPLAVEPPELIDDGSAPHEPSFSVGL